MASFSTRTRNRQALFRLVPFPNLDMTILDSLADELPDLLEFNQKLCRVNRRHTSEKRHPNSAQSPAFDHGNMLAEDEAKYVAGK